jgi:predicted O-methyltransferase YrrM
MFNRRLAEEMYGVTNEADLRKKLYGTRTDLTDAEFTCICNFLSRFNNPKYLEIGVYFGGNFLKVANFLKENKENYHLTGVDLFESIAQYSAMGPDLTHDILNKWNILNVAYEADLFKFLKSCEINSFDLVRGVSDKAVREIDKTFDVMFIDGNHTFDQTLKDAESCMERSKVGSFLIFHNASSDIQPDPQYIEKDGGPWAVCEKFKSDDRLKYIGLFDRCSVFEVIK